MIPESPRRNASKSQNAQRTMPYPHRWTYSHANCDNLVQLKPGNFYNVWICYFSCLPLYFELDPLSRKKLFGQCLSQLPSCLHLAYCHSAQSDENDNKVSSDLSFLIPEHWEKDVLSSIYSQSGSIE